MRKGIPRLASCAVAAVLAFVAGHADAQERAAEAVGCAVLADVVHGEIFVSALFGSHRLPPEPGPGEASSCASTAASASSGFSRAMAALNVHVVWSAPEAHGSTVCTAGDLARCTPLPKLTMSSGALDSASVAEMWRVVVSAVGPSMPLGTIGDRSSFREYELRIRLSDALVNRYWNAYGWARPRSAY